MVAAGRGVSRAAEIGTGTGVASAWIASALPPGAPLYTVDRDELRAAAAKTLFADDPDVHALTGDWRSALAANAPFDFIHIADDDARGAIDEVVSLAVPRATLVLDDDPAGVDSVDGDVAKWREAWASHPRLDATVIDAGRERPGSSWPSSEVDPEHASIG